MFYRSVFQLSVLLFWVLSHIVNGEEKQGYISETTSRREYVERRAPSHELELFIIADYSMYKTWYDRTNDSNDVSKRQHTTIMNVKEYLGAMVNSADMTYRSLEKYGVYVKLNLVEIQVVTNANESHWTEDYKEKNGSGYKINGDQVIDSILKTSMSLRLSKPHDHMMLVTSYNMYINRSQTYSDVLGLANVGGTCENNSVSFIEDSRDMYTAYTIAHELGHSLGAEHDGQNNNCSMHGKYIMANGYNKSTDLNWTFSKCTAGYILKHIDRLNRGHANCLTTINNRHPDKQVSNYSKLFYGDHYSAYDQCRIKYGPGSYACGEVYGEDVPYNTVCHLLYCYQPSIGKCFGMFAGDHTICGNNEWCILGTCVTAHTVIDTCHYGDQLEFNYFGHTCRDLVKISPRQCYTLYIKIHCCESCPNATNITHVSIAQHPDLQCRALLGPSTRFCPTLEYYSKETFRGVCQSLYCWHRNGCAHIIAADGTPCGRGKWCLQSECVMSSSAPNASDDCLYGDAIGPLSTGKTCTDVVHDDPPLCYDSFYSKQCCTSCAKLATNVTGCQYGDKASWCSFLQPGVNMTYCYATEYREICCETCERNKLSRQGCEYGDRHALCDHSLCGAYDQHSRDFTCCKTCANQASVIVG